MCLVLRNIRLYFPFIEQLALDERVFEEIANIFIGRHHFMHQ